MTKQTDAIKIRMLEEENKILQQKLAESASATIPVGDSIINEMKKIQQRGQVKRHTINVISKSDFKRISLWTK